MTEFRGRRAGWAALAVPAVALAASAGCGGTVETGSGSGGAKGGTTSSVTSSAMTGAGATTGSSTSVSSSSSSSSATTGSVGSSSSSSGGASCNPACSFGLSCCNGACVELDNDLLNCGACGKVCEGMHPFCNNGVCGTPACSGTPCSSADFCCGSECCGAGELCCDTFGGPVQANPHCAMPVGGTCPQSCFACN